MLLVIGYTVVILKVAVGLGFVIFVHELGHFAVAKLCGVKCEKFYLGFDIGGLKLCKFRWGETEYGIGILPLGGYVKMLGQEDNPARLREEMERARRAQEGGGGRGTGDGGKAESGTPKADEGQVVGGRRPGARGETITKSPNQEISKSSSPPSPAPSPAPLAYDPRSFLAKSVPKRMAIIAAGVIMNIIFAFVMAVVAFGIGVKQTPCVIGSLLPGDPAWQADLRVGDEVLEIAGKKMEQFRDLQTAISLGDIDETVGVPIVVRRPGVKEPLTITVKPDRSRGAFFIGVGNPYTTQLVENRLTWLVLKRPPAAPGSPAACAEPPFENNDEIVKIDDVPIVNFEQIASQLARKADRQIGVTVLRTERDAEGKPTGAARRVQIPIAPLPMLDLGLALKMGPIVAVQANSPAAAAGIQPGDEIQQIDGRPIVDPMRLPDQLNRRAGETVALTILRKESKQAEIVPVKLREPLGITPGSLILDDSPLAVSSLGVAIPITNEVAGIIPESPASKQEFASGDRLVRARIIPPGKESLEKLDREQRELTVPASADETNWWPEFLHLLQDAAPGTTVELTYTRGKTEKKATLAPVAVADWFDPDRGLVFEPAAFDRKAKSFDEAVRLGGQETFDAVTIVFRSVKKLGTAQVSPRALAGPVMIFKMALYKADQGTSALLLFLTLLSANLAVINFLPIPVLDGGHFVLLAYEGIRGKPANERVHEILSYIGLALILALMFWVLGLDLGLISRH